MGIADWIKDYGSPVAWLVAAVGLIYNNHAANTREKRKEFRSEIDAIEKLLKTLVEKLAIYLKTSERNGAVKSSELEIKVLFKEVDLKWERLSKRQTGGELGLLIDPCSDALEQFFDQSTGKYFETSDRPPEDELATHLEKIHIRALVLTEALHSLFLKKFDGV